jgi:uncharacterized phage protein (TIGR01671 family)
MKPKFRVWSLVSKEFVKQVEYYKGQHENTGKILISPDGELWQSGMYDDMGTIHGGEKENYIVQQFTGLKDKNGVEIYEGDVLSTKHTGQSKYDRSDLKLRVVKRDSRTCQLALFALDEERWPASGFQLSTSTFNRFQVIGNIYENKEEGV